VRSAMTASRGRAAPNGFGCNAQAGTRQRRARRRDRQATDVPWCSPSCSQQRRPPRCEARRTSWGAPRGSRPTCCEAWWRLERRMQKRQSRRSDFRLFLSVSRHPCSVAASVR
jgi:hypothetical protein